jgi:hypothetical protein
MTKFRFVEDTANHYYMIPVELEDEFVKFIDGKSTIDFSQYRLTYHLSEFSFENPVRDKDYIGLHE